MMKNRATTRRTLRTLAALFVIAVQANIFGQGFVWFGNENSRDQSARVYFTDGTFAAGLIKMDRVRTHKIREITVGRTSKTSVYDTDKESRQLRGFNLVNLEGRKIRPFETDSVVINSLTGISCDSLWLFKIIDGKIAAFNTRPLWRSREFTHIQKRGGAIERYSRDLLAEYLNDDEHALSLFSAARYRDGRSAVLKEYNPRRAILEYNFQTVSRYFKADSLLTLLKREKTPERKVAISGEILALDSTFHEPYLVLGDHAAGAGNTGEAYELYTRFLIFCDSAAKMRNVRQKITALQRKPLY